MAKVLGLLLYLCSLSALGSDWVEIELRPAKFYLAQEHEVVKRGHFKIDVLADYQEPWRLTSPQGRAVMVRSTVLEIEILCVSYENEDRLAWANSMRYFALPMAAGEPYFVEHYSSDHPEIEKSLGVAICKHVGNRGD